tara:strand:+ start:11156 stop:11392 length:237 start_codon:yes stop_codon:yes gene_type:complete
MSAPTEAARGRTTLIVTAAALLALVIGANAHLLYVSFASQPDCVPHHRIGERPNRETFAAAASSCRPSMQFHHLRSDR